MPRNEATQPMLGSAAAPSLRGPPGSWQVDDPHQAAAAAAKGPIILSLPPSFGAINVRSPKRRSSSSHNDSGTVDKERREWPASAVPNSFCFQPKSAQPRPTVCVSVTNQRKSYFPFMFLSAVCGRTAIVKSVRVGKSLSEWENKRGK